MVTTLKVSLETKKMLESMKILEGESYEDVILHLIEDHLELNPKFKEELERAAKEVKKGKTIPLAKVLEEVKIGD
jgi:predicted CopG family antitoxin